MDIKVVKDIIDKLAAFNFNSISVNDKVVVVSKRTNNINIMINITGDEWSIWTTDGTGNRTEVKCNENAAIKQLQLLLEVEQLKQRIAELTTPNDKAVSLLREAIDMLRNVNK